MSFGAVAKDVTEPNQDRQVNPAEDEVIDELLQIDRSCGVFRRMDDDVAGR